MIVFVLYTMCFTWRLRIAPGNETYYYSILWLKREGESLCHFLLCLIQHHLTGVRKIPWQTWWNDPMSNKLPFFSQ